jgi:hypothetical protein
MRTRLLVSFFILFGSVEARAQCDPALFVLPDGTANPSPVVISEVNPGPGGYIELYNSTGASVNLNGWFFCSPFAYAALGAVSIGAFSYRTFAWPVTFADDDGGGEVMLYDSALFNNSNDIMDYVCWGGSNAFRLAQAVTTGKWTGGHAPALVNGAIHRITQTTGTGAASYDVTAAPSPMNCAGAPTGIDDTPSYPSIALSIGPNPFSALATIEFTVSSEANVSAEVYSVTGERVRRLQSAAATAGTGRVLWDGKDDSGRALPSGTYLVRVSANSSSVTQRVTIVR